MGTRSICAVPHEGGFRGRYVHWDGYPTAKVPTLLTLVQRDGLERVTEVLTVENYGWSALHDAQPDITDVSPDPQAEFGTPAYEAAQFTTGPYGDGRFRNVPGYGVAYTTHEGQSSEDEWIGHEGDDGGAEWAYVLTPSEIIVYERVYKDRQGFDGHATGFFGVSRDGSECAWIEKGRVGWGTDNDGTEFEDETE